MKMLNSSRESGPLKGLAHHPINGGVSPLQYADDTTLLMRNGEESFATVKFHLYYFAVVYMHKINYQKSKVSGMGILCR